MDLTQFRSKLVGSDDERAVSPVIGVILMVAITVILAAVIAAFVLDLGDSVGQEAQAGVNLDLDESDENLSVEVTSLGNADFVALGGDADDADDTDEYEAADDPLESEQLTVGDSVTINLNVSESEFDEQGTITAIAVIEEDETTTQVGSESWDFS